MEQKIDISTLDMEEIGLAVVGQLASSRRLGHTTVQSTLKHYVEGSRNQLSPEARFMLDAFTKPVAKVYELWDMKAADLRATYMAGELIK